MEGLKLRTFIVAGLFLATAGLIAVSSRPVRSSDKDENWMKKVAPAKVASFEYMRSPSDPGSTYQSPQLVYDELKPTVGILARVYEANGQRYDVNLIASSSKASFHDPRVCFSSQGYDIYDEQGIQIPTKTRGEIPATMVKMHKDSGDTFGIFFYRGPRGFYGSTMSLKLAMLWDQITGKSDLDGVFYRFIPVGDNNPDRLVAFVSAYMDEAGKLSNGYF